MPATTPNRGYEYPCYSDLVDFPAQMQTFAEDVDADVQAIIDNIDDARTLPPSCRASGSVGTSIAINTWSVVIFTTEEFDNNTMFTAGGSTFTATTEGLYLISARVVWLPAGGRRGIAFRNVGSGQFYAAQFRQANPSFNHTTDLKSLTYLAAGTTINLQVATDTLAATNEYDVRTMSMTRMSGTTTL